MEIQALSSGTRTSCKTQRQDRNMICGCTTHNLQAAQDCMELALVLAPSAVQNLQEPTEGSTHMNRYGDAI